MHSFFFFPAPHVSVTISSTRALGHLFNACSIPATWMKKKIDVHPSHPWQGTLPNVLGGQVAAESGKMDRGIGGLAPV